MTNTHLLTPHGSDDYYALRRISYKQQICIDPLLAWYETVSRILYRVSDDSIAHVKFQWWREEISALYQGKATHPITCRLQTSITTTPWQHDDFTGIIDTLESSIGYCRFETFEDLVCYSMQTIGAREKMIAALLSPGTPTNHIIPFGLTLTLTQVIRELRAHLSHSFIYIDQATCDGHGVSFNDWFSLKTTEGMRHVLCDYTNRAHLSTEEGLNTLSRLEKKQLRFILLRCRLALKNLDLIAEEHYNVLEKRIALNPLFKWYLTIV